MEFQEITWMQFPGINIIKSQIRQWRDLFYFRMRGWKDACPYGTCPRDNGEWRLKVLENSLEKTKT